MKNLSADQLSRYIDHTLLTPQATPAQVQELVHEAARLDTWSVCVSPTMVAYAAHEVQGLDAIAGRDHRLAVASVCGFPSGAHTPQTKAAEARQAVVDGADEIDMVINLALVMTGCEDDLRREIAAVREQCPGVLKVIIKSAVLSDDQIIMACHAAEAAGADFVKTSTGFHPSGGASTHAVELMAATVGGRLGVKASGGIRDYSTAMAMIQAGATRLGCSASTAILADAPK